MTHDEHAEELAGLAAELSDPRDQEVTTQVIVARAVEMVDGAEHASLTVRQRRTFTTLAATSDLATEVDRAQYELDEGPCVDSSLTGDWFRSGDLLHDHRWPRWGPVAAGLGTRSTLSIRLLSKGRPFGALNFYAADAGGFADPDEVELAQLFTVHATSALVAARLVADLETAMSSRHDIGVAQGILMGKYGLTLEVAFAALRRVSRHDNVKLRDVAREVIRTGRLPQPAEEDSA